MSLLKLLHGPDHGPQFLDAQFLGVDVLDLVNHGGFIDRLHLLPVRLPENVLTKEDGHGYVLHGHSPLCSAQADSTNALFDFEDLFESSPFIRPLAPSIQGAYLNAKPVADLLFGALDLAEFLELDLAQLLQRGLTRLGSGVLLRYLLRVDSDQACFLGDFPGMLLFSSDCCGHNAILSAFPDVYR